MPPVVPSDNEIVEPTHTGALLYIGVTGFTVTTTVFIHPVGIMYVIVEVPPDTPVTIPVTGSTSATVGVLVLQLPPLVPSVKLVVKPTQTVALPLMPAGIGSTVTKAVATQPNGSVYITVSTPSTSPVTTPDDEPILALALLTLHVPPVAASLKVDVKPRHTSRVPVIGAKEFTVTTAVTIQPNEEV